MNRVTAIVSAAVLAALWSATPTAQDDGRYSVYGHGARSCGSWTADRSAAARLAYQSWALGFLSGAGFAGAGPLRATDSSGVIGWLDRYCLDHPLDNVSIATGALVRELSRPQ